MIRNLVLIIFSIALAFIVNTNERPAFAQTCDPDFEAVMNARASEEAMREIEIAQKLILKPDSVLEYSCFNSAVVRTGGSDIFSDAVLDAYLFKLPPDMYTPSGPYAAYLPTIDDTQVTAPNFNGNFRVQPGADAPGGALTAFGLDNSLSNLVLISMIEYLNYNFGHVFAGGYFATPSGASCNAMDLVWKFFKCSNFKALDFLTFQELSFIDPRDVPSYPGLNCNDPNRNSVWTAAINAANPAPGAAGGVEPMTSHIDKFNPACSGVTPVPTGVVVFLGGPPVEQTFRDAVCPAPGCYYQGSSNTCVP